MEYLRLQGKLSLYTRRLSRLVIVLLLALPPIPLYADETTVTEGFDNQQINQDITFVYGGNDTALTAETDCDVAQVPGSINIEDMDCHGSEYFGSDRYQLGTRSSTDALTIAFPNSETKPITEVGFLTLAVDDANTGTVYYEDSTSATFNIVSNASGNSQVTLTAPAGTTINEIVIAGASDNLGDWWLIDNVYYKYTATTPTTTTTTTTTTTVPPPPPTTTTTLPPVVIIIMDDGTEAEYETYEVEDGTVERDNERAANLEEYGCELTDAQIIRGDCDVEIYEDEIYEEEIYEEGEELLDDGIIILEISDDDDFEELEFIELTEEEILEIEKEMEIEAKELEILDEELEFLEDLSEEELEEYVEVILEIEEYIEEVEEFEIEIIEVEEEIDLIDVLIANDIFPPDPEEVLKDLESVQDDLIPEVEEEFIDDEPEILEDEEPIEEILTEEIIEEEVAEIEEVIEDIVIEEVTTEEVVEVLEEVNDIGVQNLSEATEEVQEIVQAVVEEAIEEIEELTEEQVEVVAEILQVEAEDVEIIAEAVKDDEIVAEAVEEYIERAVENKDVENYTLADVVTEVQYEQFLENPIETFVDFDNLEEITFENIGDDMTSDQREKAQEVVVPVILTRIVSMAAFIMRRS